MNLRFFILTVLIVFSSCRTAFTPESVCMSECENGYRSCMDSCNQMNTEPSPDYYTSQHLNFGASGNNCLERCADISDKCRKNCGNPIPPSYPENSGDGR